MKTTNTHDEALKCDEYILHDDYNLLDSDMKKNISNSFACKLRKMGHKCVVHDKDTREVKWCKQKKCVENHNTCTNNCVML